MELSIFSDLYFMQEALKEARKALEKGEIPIGAVVVCQNRIIARAHNLTQHLNDVTAHAEMQSFTAAAEFLGGKYLRNCMLYVTLEPCSMCANASYWAQIGRIVYGAADSKRGFSTISKSLLHPKTEIEGGLLEEECGALLTEFFKKKRF